MVAGPDGWDLAAYRTAVAELATAIGSSGWVGYEERDRADVLSGTSAFAFPSRYEGFGFPPLEAMQAGVPVVVAAGGALPEVVGDAAVVVPVGDVDGLAAALADVLDDEARRADLRERGLARASSYSWDRAVAGLVDVYRTVAGGY